MGACGLEQGMRTFSLNSMLRCCMLPLMIALSKEFCLHAAQMIWSQPVKDAAARLTYISGNIFGCVQRNRADYYCPLQSLARPLDDDHQIGAQSLSDLSSQ